MRGLQTTPQHGAAPSQASAVLAAWCRLWRGSAASQCAAGRRRNLSAQQQQRQRTLRRPVVSAAASPAPPAESASSSRPLKRLAIFVSGGGSNFRAIHAAIQRTGLNAEVAVVVSNAPSCGGVAYAQQHGIPTLTYPAPKSSPGAGLTDDQLVEELQQRGVDFIILAGYMKLIPQQLVRAYHRAMLNIHPGLLPGFGGKGMYGLRVHAAVIASGARVSGPTVHFVDEEYDTGPILAQAGVEGLPTDTPEQLAARVLAQEHVIYPQCVAALVEGRITWREDGVPVAWSAH